MKLDTILVPIDFSERARPAADYAVNLANHFDSRVIFLHAIPPSPYAAYGGGQYPWFTWTSDSEPEGQLRSWLDDLVKKVAPHDQVEKLVEKGDPARKIAEVVKQKKVDLVVMSTHGYGPFRRFVLGSVTSKVLHDVDCPVFTGAHIETVPPYEPKPFRRIGCAVDLKQHSEEILRWAADFAEAYEARLWVIHALPEIQAIGPGAPIVTKPMAELVQEGTEEVKKLIGKVGATAEVFVESGEAQRVVPRVAGEENIDLLVIGRRGEEGLMGRLKTHSYALIRESPCPVVSV